MESARQTQLVGDSKVMKINSESSVLLHNSH